MVVRSWPPFRLECHAWQPGLAGHRRDCAGWILEYPVFKFVRKMKLIFVSKVGTVELIFLVAPLEVVVDRKGEVQI
jgi:hypothetical protein